MEAQFLKCLIVEDDPMVCQINEEFAKRIDGITEVKSAKSIALAKQILLQEDFDIIFLDLYFPKGTGVDLIKWVRQEDLEVDIIMITADRSVEMVQKTFRYGVVDYLIKPFTFSRFSDAVKKVLKKSNAVSDVKDMNQSMIDSFMNENVKYSTSRIDGEKGLSPQTYDKIRKGVKIFEKPFTADQLSEKIGLSRITVRRYLEHMCDSGELKCDLVYGKIGRPQKHYIKR